MRIEIKDNIGGVLFYIALLDSTYKFEDNDNNEDIWSGKIFNDLKLYSKIWEQVCFLLEN